MKNTTKNIYHDQKKKNFDVFFYVLTILFIMLFIIIKKPPFGEAVFMQIDMYKDLDVNSYNN